MSFEKWNAESLNLYDGGDAEVFVEHIRACYAELDALTQAVAAERKKGEWRPISEAPKDGTPFLVYMPEGKPFFASAKFNDPEAIQILVINGKAKLVTHFCPLPTPPLAGEAKEKEG